MSQLPNRILFADDDPTMGLLMQAVLGKAGFAVTVVDNGAAALAEFEQAAFDLVLLDVEMPVMDGFEVGAAIRQSPRCHTPVILVSSHDDPVFHARVKALSAGHIAKPVNWAALPDMLRQLLAAAPR